jgi:hypothetical protein
MGHVNHDDLKRMVKEASVTGIELDMDSKLEPCQTCLKVKATQKPFPKQSLRENITKYGSKISANVWGPTYVQSLGGKKYRYVHVLPQGENILLKTEIGCVLHIQKV